MAGRTCLVTGATSGIGREVARGLAAQGATVVLAVRSAERGAAARADVVASTGNEDVHLLLVDLERQASVRAAAKEYMARFPRLDVLVLNAGMHTARRVLTEDGVESTFCLLYTSPSPRD